MALEFFNSLERDNEIEQRKRDIEETEDLLRDCEYIMANDKNEIVIQQQKIKAYKERLLRLIERLKEAEQTETQFDG